MLTYIGRNITRLCEAIPLFYLLFFNCLIIIIYKYDVPEENSLPFIISFLFQF